MKEAELQKQCEEWLEWEKVEYLHIPDNLYKFIYSPVINQAISRNSALYGWLQGTRKMVSKYLLGLPDIILFTREGNYLAIELKTKTGKVRQGQKNKALKMSVTVCRSFKEFQESVNKWSENLAKE